MISIHASAVCRVRDGYTGRPLGGSVLLCTLDGVAFRPVAKPGGYLVLVNLAPGSHRLSLRSRGYQEEWVEFQADGGTRELDITMKPGEGYPFRYAVARLLLTTLAGDRAAVDRRLWLAVSGRFECKLAQTKAEAGDQEVRLYCRGQKAVPGSYLISDDADSEIVNLRAMEGERGVLAVPLCRDHSRGRRFLPAQGYHTGGDGRLTAVYREPCTVEVFAEEGGLLAGIPLAVGDNEYTIRLEEGE